MLLIYRERYTTILYSYCFSDEDSSEGTARSEFTVKVIY
jgi:hypothetical protein